MTNNKKDNQIITPKEFAKLMKEMSTEGDGTPIDIEVNHSQMDNLMCDVLIRLGYEEGVDIYLNTEKWYS